jgi:hypothetical protein
VLAFNSRTGSSVIWILARAFVVAAMHRLTPDLVGKMTRGHTMSYTWRFFFLGTNEELTALRKRNQILELSVKSSF